MTSSHSGQWKPSEQRNCPRRSLQNSGLQFMRSSFRYLAMIRILLQLILQVLLHLKLISSLNRLMRDFAINPCALNLNQKSPSTIKEQLYLYGQLISPSHHQLFTCDMSLSAHLPILAQYLTNEDLLELGQTSKDLQHVCHLQLTQRFHALFAKFHSTLLSVYSYRKKEIQVLPKDLYKISKQMAITLKYDAVRVALREFPELFLKVTREQVPLDDVFEDDHKLNTQVNTAFKITDRHYIVLNRTLVDPSLNIELAEIDRDTKKEMLQELANSKEFQMNYYDDMQVIKNRQKQILERIDESIKKAEKEQRELQEPRLASLLHLRRIAIVLCHGGYFSIGIYENHICTYHKSDHKYVTRGKAGQRQLNKDSNAGSHIMSIGSQIRRENEKKHQEKVNNILTEAYPQLENCQLILLQAPGVNYQILIKKENPLFKLRHKIRSICLTAKKANHTEVERIHKIITNIYIVERKQ